MKTIWKYTLEAKEHQILRMPAGSQILSAQEQFGSVVLYALVNPSSATQANVDVRVYGTGHDVPDLIEHYTFLNTVKLENGVLMFHVFYLMP